MPQLTWSPRALIDVQRLYRFLAPKNPGAAERAVREIQSRVRFLTRFPEIGRPAEEYGPGRRELSVRFGDAGYVILYRYDGNEVVVVAVRHMREAGFEPEP